MTDWWDEDPFVGELPSSLLIQFGSDACVHCPMITLMIDGMQNKRCFTWSYRDAMTNDLATELNITSLPAVLVYHANDNWILYERLRGNDVVEIIEEAFPPRLILDEDF